MTSCKEFLLLIVKSDDATIVEEQQKILEEVATPNVQDAPLLYFSNQYNITASIKVNQGDRKIFASIFRVLGFTTNSGWVDLDYGYHASNDEWTTILSYEDFPQKLKYYVSCKR
jgi:hypothetical protein